MKRPAPFVAIFNRDMVQLKTYIEAGGNPDKRFLFHAQKYFNALTPRLGLLWSQSLLCYAVSRDWLDGVKYLRQAGARFPLTSGSYGCPSEGTFLHHTSECTVEMVQYLLDEGVDPQAEDGGFLSPIIGLRNPQAIRLLVNAGVNPNDVGGSNIYAPTPLTALFQGHTHSPVNLPFDPSDSRHLETLTTLLDVGTNPLKVDVLGRSPLEVFLLYSTSHENYNSSDYYKRTKYRKAMLPVIRMLVEAEMKWRSTHPEPEAIA